MNIIKGAEIARKTILQRSLTASYAATPVMQERINKLFGEELSLEEAVARIVTDVKEKGDMALFDYTQRIDNVKLSRLEVTRAEIDDACNSLNKEIYVALNLAAERINSFHRSCLENSARSFSANGLGQVVRPLTRVGVYVPGGTASYPSTVLMTALPAKVAGVEDVIMVTPPGRDGKVSAIVLAAARIAGIEHIFKVGGAQAIAALAFGTASIPRVDKICGPGNVFVTLAKKMLYGVVGIDGLYGPTETVIIADETADPAICAADLLAQAEHDMLSSALLITDSMDFAQRVDREVDLLQNKVTRGDIIRESLHRGSGIIVVDSVKEAIELANSFAPEHLSVMVRDGHKYISQIKNAGGIFIGEASPEVLGDYVAGPSHVMPTGGSARFTSALGVSDFLKISSLVAVEGNSSELLDAAALIARAEGLDAHAIAAEIRKK